MKQLAPLACALFLLCSCIQSLAQGEVNRERFPHVTEDYTFENPINVFGKHVITLDGAWGLGFQATYLQKNLLYASAEVGYGWVIAAYDKYPQDDYKPRKFRPWVHLRAGYPAFTFVKGTRGKYTTSYGYNNQNQEVENFYRIKAPTHITLIPEFGYCINPHPARIYQISNGNYGPWTSVLAHTINVGLRVRSLSKTRVSIRDAQTGQETRGTTYRYGEVYFGAVIPTRDMIDRPHENYNDLPKTPMGYQVIFRIPTRHNGFASFDIGVRATGYVKSSGDSPGEPTYQLVLGNTIFGSAE